MSVFSDAIEKIQVKINQALYYDSILALEVKNEKGEKVAEFSSTEKTEITKAFDATVAEIKGLVAKL